MRSLVIFLFITLLSGRLAADSPPSICTFVPPSGWEIAKQIQPSPYVQIGFVGKGSGPFHPSINLAFEEVDVGLKEYAKAVKEVHLSDPNAKCRDLGKFNMLAGEGRLFDLTISTPHGEIRQLQALFVKNGKAYVLTIAASKNDFPKLQSQMIQSLQSLNLLSDLLEPLEPKQKVEIESILKTMKNEPSTQNRKIELGRLRKILSEKYSSLGLHWQYLVLSEGVSSGLSE